MGIFDPKVEANIPLVEPQVQKSALGDIASWLGKGIGDAQKRAAQGGPTAGERKDALELAQGVGLQNSLLKAEALRRDGRIDEANRAEQRVLANAARDGVDLSSGQTKALYRATTGRDPEFMGMSMEERMAEQAMKDPAFQSAFIASYASGKEMTDEERTNASFGQMARMKANEMMLDNNSIDWDQGRSQAFTGAIVDFNASTLGALNLHAQQGGVIGIDAINQSQLQWEARKSMLLSQRPQGITTDQWKPVQDQIDQTDRTFKTLLEISQVEGSRGLTAQAMQPIAAALMADKDLTELERYAAINSLPKLVELGVVGPAEVYGVLKSVKVPDISTSTFSSAEAAGGFTDPTTGETSLFSPEIMGSVKDLDPVETLNQAKNIAKVNGFASADEMARDPAARDSFMLLTSKSFAAMTTISKDNREFASSKTINEVFDGKVVANIDAVAVTDPSKARMLFLQGEEALNQQHAIAVVALQNTIKADSPLVWNEETETLDFQFNSLTRMGIKEPQLLELRDAADKHYGGDFLAMAKDQGRKLRVANDMENAYRMINTGTIQGLIGDAQELTALAGTVRTLNEKRKIFSDKADGLQVEKPVQTTATTIIAQDMRDRTEEFSQIRGFDKVAENSGFLNSVGESSNRLGIDASWLLGVISFETVGTFSTSIKNPNGSATGLIQFIEKTAKGLGTSTAQLKNMNHVEQMKYVEKYFTPYKGKMKNLGDVYMAVHWPAAVGKDDDYVMYKRGSKEYGANKNLDLDNDGVVTRGDTLQRVRSVFGSGGFSEGPSRGPENGAMGGTVPPVTVTPIGSAAEGVGLTDIVDTAVRGIESAGSADATAAASATQVTEEPSGTDAKPQPSAKEDLGKSVSKRLDAQAMAKLVDKLQFFKDEAEAKAALAAGKAERGTPYVTEDGEIRVLQ